MFRLCVRAAVALNNRLLPRLLILCLRFIDSPFHYDRIAPQRCHSRLNPFGAPSGTLTVPFSSVLFGT